MMMLGWMTRLIRKQKRRAARLKRILLQTPIWMVLNLQQICFFLPNLFSINSNITKPDNWLKMAKSDRLINKWSGDPAFADTRLDDGLSSVIPKSVSCRGRMDRLLMNC